MSSRLLRWLLLAAMLLPSRLPAQSTFATITGTVTDSTGAVVPGAKVTVTHQATNLTYSTESNTAGAYTLANLREGDYRLVAGSAGFKDVTVDRIALAGRDVRRVDVTLQVGTVQESVEVTAAAGLIETENARISDVRTANELNSYAANATSRSAWRYFSLSPMFVNIRGGSVPSLAGSRADQWQVAFDGSTISNGMSGNTGGNIMDYSDWIREVRTDYVTNSAENGQLANISVISKAGENDVHGAAFDIYGSPIFRARPPFTLTRPVGVTHNLGVSGGGPVYVPKLYNGKNRTFWYVAGEEYTGSVTSAPRNATVPIQSWRNGQFPVPIRNPFTGETYMDGKIPAQYINPVSKQLQDIFFPLPNYGDVTSGVYSSNFRSTGLTPFNTQLNLMTRVDERFGDKDYVYATFMMNQLKQRGLEGSLPVFGPRNGLRKQKMLNVTYSHTFRHNLLNEFRFGHGADTNDVRGTFDAASLVKSLGIQGLAPDLPDMNGFFNMSFSGTGITGTSGVSRSLYAPRTETFQDQVSWFKGKQNIRIGGLFAYAHPTELSASSNLFGNASFSGKFTTDGNVKGSGNAYADFLFGIPASTQRAYAPLTARRRRTWQDLFLQDTWRVSSKLTLDLGVRYEYRPAWHEDSGLMAVFDPATAAMVVPDGSLGKVSPLLPKTYHVISASQAGYPANLIQTDKNNVAPRFGIAWQPFQTRTVLRGGYGIYYDATPTQVNMAGQPFMIDEAGYTNPYPAAGGVVFPAIMPAAGSGQAASVSLSDSFNPRLKIPYSQQWSATIEHEVAGFGLRLNYAGTATHQMIYGRDINAPVPDDRLYFNKPRPYQLYATAIPYYDNGGNHTYHGASVTVTRRMKQGLQMESSYTWARDIGDAVSGLIENPFDRSRERGPELSIPTQRFATSWIWEMPFGHHRLLLSNLPRALDAAIGGWQLAGNFILQSGQFLTPTITVDDPVGIFATTSNTPSRKAIRPDLLADPNNGPKTVAKWFDPSVFAAPPKGRLGNSGRGVIIGPGINVWHATLQKYFRFSDNPRMPRMRLDLFAANVFNHPNYDNPNVNLSSGASTATITDTGGINRSTLGDSANDRLMRVGLRIEW